jgi:hypothetical protein
MLPTPTAQVTRQPGDGADKQMTSDVEGDKAQRTGTDFSGQCPHCFLHEQLTAHLVLYSVLYTEDAQNIDPWEISKNS